MMKSHFVVLRDFFFSPWTWVASLPKAFNSPALKEIIVFDVVTLFTKNKQKKCTC